MKPASSIEDELVARTAAYFWRLRRIPVFEAAILENRRTEVTGPIDHTGGDPNRLAWLETFDKPPYSEKTKQLRREIIKASVMAKPDSRAVMGLALIRDGQQNDTLGKLSRYEAALLNAVDRTLRQLFVTQNTRISREPEQIVVTPRGASKK